MRTGRPVAAGDYSVVSTTGADGCAQRMETAVVSHHSELIDTTEMYLRTVYELEEEGVVPLRARIAERLGQSGPTVSQTVARMERDGLVLVAGDRHLQLTDIGRKEAIGVMRKHRLAERLLHDVIGLDWEDVHIEACRWEHVMSEAVERRIVALLDKPLVCPHGSPIPGLDELGLPFSAADDTTELTSLTAAARLREGESVRIDRISEHVQPDAELMHRLNLAGVRPGRPVAARAVAGGLAVTTVDGTELVFGPEVTDHIFVRTAELAGLPG